MKPRILFVHNHLTRFVETDLSLLREQFEVDEWRQTSRFFDFVALSRAVRQSNLVFGWFASWHTYLPLKLARRYRRPTVLVTGGYDTANMPQIGYGSQRGGIKRRIALATVHSADALIVNSRFARDEAISNAGADPARTTVIYHGFEAPSLPILIKKERMVITVGNVERSTLERKGLTTFTRAAAQLPHVPFVLIGRWQDDAVQSLKDIGTPNLAFAGQLSLDDMNSYFERAAVYVQASRHEAFGMAVAEAMLYECIPVVTCAGALPEVVGETGIKVDSFEPAAIAHGIAAALLLDEYHAGQARERIIREFPLERRRIAMNELLRRTLNG